MGGHTATPQLPLISARDEGRCLKNATPTVPVLPSQRDWEQLPPLRLATPTQLCVLRPSWAADPGERHLAQGRPSNQSRPQTMAVTKSHRGGKTTTQGPCIQGQLQEALVYE